MIVFRRTQHSVITTLLAVPLRNDEGHWTSEFDEFITPKEKNRQRMVMKIARNVKNVALFVLWGFLLYKVNFPPMDIFLFFIYL